MIMHFINFESEEQAKIWCDKAQEVIITFKEPLFAHLTPLANDSCMFSYQSIWRLLKQLNFTCLNPANARPFTMQNKQIEQLLTRVALFLSRRNNNNLNASGVDLIDL